MVDLAWSRPSDPAVDPFSVVVAPPRVELSSEVAEGAEVNPPYEDRGEAPLEALELLSAPRGVRSPVEDRDPVLRVELAELLRDEGAPGVDVKRLRLAPPP